MHKRPIVPALLISLILVIGVLACGLVTQSPQPTTMPPPTETPEPTATNTPPPTETPLPTATPNLAATQQVEGWQANVQHYQEHGYIDSVEGEYAAYDDFAEDWAQIGWYKWVPFSETDSNFMFGAHLNWSTAGSTSDISGCGIVFGLQSNDDHYAVILDKARILFMMSRGGTTYSVGKTRGSGRVSFGNPAEADFQVLVKDQKAYVSVDGDITDYTLSVDQTTRGEIGFTVLSGTNRDYGTRCKMTDVHIWTPQ